MVKQVIVIRRDLKMRRGKECAQAAHASMKVLLEHFQMNPYAPRQRKITSHSGALKEWLTGAFTKVCVRADSERELIEIIKKATDKRLPVAKVIDAGKTEFRGVPTLTCAAIGPADADQIDEITGNLKLM